MENWKPVAGYEGRYEVSDLGRVRSLVSNKVLAPHVRNKGYLCVQLYLLGEPKSLSVHRLVAEAFVPNPDGKPQVNHLDENPVNNAASNLEWCTCKENINWGTRTARMMKTIGKPVVQVAADGSVLATYPAVMEASRATGIGHTNIFRVLKGGRKTAGGYAWRYA